MARRRAGMRGGGGPGRWGGSVPGRWGRGEPGRWGRGVPDVGRRHAVYACLSLRIFTHVYACLRKVYARFTQGLRKIYARFTQGFRTSVAVRKPSVEKWVTQVYAKFTQVYASLRRVYAKFTHRNP